jgi:hypothetical protein
VRCKKSAYLVNEVSYRAIRIFDQGEWPCFQTSEKAPTVLVDFYSVPAEALYTFQDTWIEEAHGANFRVHLD